MFANYLFGMFVAWLLFITVFRREPGDSELW